MLLPRVLLTGFGPFLDVSINASGEIARALQGKQLEGAEVNSFVLPVSFDRLAPAYAEALAELVATPPVALLSLGVHRGRAFRLERRARPVLDSGQLDCDGVAVSQLERLGARELNTQLDIERLTSALLAGGAGEVLVSDNAGGYVCERCYYEVLSQAERLGVPGLFLHVPPVELVPVADQIAPVQSLIEEVVRQAAQ